MITEKSNGKVSKIFWIFKNKKRKKLLHRFRSKIMTIEVSQEDHCLVKFKEKNTKIYYQKISSKKGFELGLNTEEGERLMYWDVQSIQNSKFLIIDNDKVELYQIVQNNKTALFIYKANFRKSDHSVMDYTYSSEQNTLCVLSRQTHSFYSPDDLGVCLFFFKVKGKRIFLQKVIEDSSNFPIFGSSVHLKSGPGQRLVVWVCGLFKREFKVIKYEYESRSSKVLKLRRQLSIGIPDFLPS
jgi:hypothetical protein